VLNKLATKARLSLGLLKVLFVRVWMDGKKGMMDGGVPVDDITGLDKLLAS